MSIKKVLLFILLFLFLSSPIVYSRTVRSDSKYSAFLKKLDSPFKIEEVTESNFFEPEVGILNSGIEVSFSEDTFMEMRKSGETLVIQLFGNSKKVKQNKIDKMVSNIVYKSEVSDITVLDSLDVDLKEVPDEAYSILGLNEEEFEIVAQDVRDGNLAIGAHSAPDMLLETVVEMEDIVNLGLRRDVIELDGLNSGKKELVQEFEDYKAKLLEDMKKARKHGNYDNLSLDSLIGELNWFTSALNSSKGDLIYRIFYREFVASLEEI